MFGDRIMGTWELTEWEHADYDISDFDAEVTLDLDHKTRVSIEGELNVSIGAEDYTYYNYTYSYYGLEPLDSDSDSRRLEFQTPVEAVNEGKKEYEIEVEGWKRYSDTDWECELDKDELLCDGDEGLELTFERL
jgi:hypothetical protein